MKVFSTAHSLHLMFDTGSAGVLGHPNMRAFARALATPGVHRMNSSTVHTHALGVDVLEAQGHLSLGEARELSAEILTGLGDPLIDPATFDPGSPSAVFGPLLCTYDAGVTMISLGAARVRLPSATAVAYATTSLANGIVQMSTTDGETLTVDVGEPTTWQTPSVRREVDRADMDRLISWVLTRLDI